MILTLKYGSTTPSRAKESQTTSFPKKKKTFLAQESTQEGCEKKIPFHHDVPLGVNMSFSGI
jgi:hypothetical protein